MAKDNKDNKDNKNHKKGRRYDRELLVSKIAMMRIKGKSTNTIISFLREELDMSRKIAYEVLRDAQEYIMEQTNQDIQVALVEAINKLEDIYEEADERLKLDTQKELNKLRGLYSASKIEVDFKGGININYIEPDDEEK